VRAGIVPIRRERLMRRPSASQRGYDWQWQRLRDQILAAEPYCRRCAVEGRRTPASVVDHIIPARIAPHLRLEPGNLQPLCVWHNADKREADRGRRSRSIDARGYPTDSRHPARRVTNWHDLRHQEKRF
jgi:5-methylcytosine-specific restriction protein A